MKNKSLKIISLILSLCLLTGIFATFAVNATEDLKGDVNLDGKFNTLDALIVLKHIANLTQLSEQSLAKADFNKDGKVNSLDALSILKTIAKISDPEPLCLPLATGDFVQPWFCGGWGVKAWGAHFDMLKNAGIDLIIIQGTVFRNDKDKFYNVLYDSQYVKNLPDSEKVESVDYYENCLDNMLNAAQSKGMKVLIGLNDSNTWWNESLQKNEAWINKDVEIAGNIANEIYELYKEKYPDAFHGWYFVHEMYTQRRGLEDFWAKILNKTLEKLTEIDKAHPENEPLPILFSPFFSSGSNSTPIQNGEMWDKIISQVNFRKGDIFCPQDSYGASGYSLNYIDNSLKYLKKAADKNENLVFWVNCESFYKSYPAPISRFESQLRIASKYAENIITFSYTHNYGKDENYEYDEEYRAYRDRILKSNELS